MKQTTICILITTLLLLVASTTFAQEDENKLHQEVEVSKAFRPTISNALKINTSPQVTDTNTVKPAFNYVIFSKITESNQDIIPLTAAKISAMPDPKLGVGYLKGGFGSFITPYAELFLNKRRSKTAAFGVHYKHYSSQGKITLENGQKTDAPYSYNRFSVFGKHYGRTSIFAADFAYTRNRITYYGYPGIDEIPVDNDGNYYDPLQGTKQVFHNAVLNLSLNSAKSKRESFNYKAGITADYFSAATEQKEIVAKTNLSLSKKYDGMTGILDGELSYVKTDNTKYAPEDATPDGRQTIFVRANPALLFSGKEWSFRVGANLTAILDDNEDASIEIAPNMYGEWNAIEEVLAIYIKADGYVDPNLLKNSFRKNPWRNPFIQLKNTTYQYILEGGFKGRLDSKTSFLINASYAGINDMHYYKLTQQNYTDPISLEEQLYTRPVFLPEYSDSKLFKLSGELLHTTTNALFNFRLKGNYYNYTRDDDFFPLGKPGFDITFSSHFTLDDQWLFNIDLFSEGGREHYLELYTTDPAPLTPANVVTVKADPIIDITFGATFKYTEHFHIWGKVQNALSGKHERWMGYREQPLNLMAGISYSF